MPKLYLVDGMSHIYRAFFAIRSLSTSKGQPTNALFGFTSILRKIINDDKPDYIGVCFDTKEPTFRHEAYERYKANRAEMPEELALQIPYVERICRAFRIPLVKLAGYEADDVIGTLAKRAANAGYDVTIVSNDKDMCQLVEARIRLMRADKGGYSYCDAAGVKSRMGVEPHQIVDLLGLMGDSSDNVPGAPGIGEKGAIQLVQEFGSIEEMLKRWEEVKKKSYREALRDHAEQIRLSRSLVTIATDLPIDIDFEALKLEEPDYAMAVELFNELEFKALVKEFSERLVQQQALPLAPALPEAVNYTNIESLNDLKQMIKTLWERDSFSIASSSNSTDLLELTISTRPSQAYILDFRASHILREEAVKQLSELLANGFINKYTHDAKQLITAISRYAPAPLVTQSLVEDTCIAAYLLNPEKNSYQLRELAQEMLGTQSETLAASDLILRIAPLLRRRLIDEGLENIYLRMELPLIEILVEMERVGVCLDSSVLQELSVEVDEQLQRLTKEIYVLAGSEFNINSPQQVGVVFERLNFDVSRKTKTGKISTSAEVLEELALNYELPRKILEYRELAKLKNTYIDALPKLINPLTGRLHTTFKQTSTTTGRISSTNPNLQNIPIRTEVGRKIRRAFVAGEGYQLLSADYSQIELRLLAHITEDKVMTEAFLHHEDIHTRTAREVFRASTDEELKEKRRLAKATNFGIAYGVGPYGLSQNVGISIAEAKKVIEDYYKTYTGVRRYMEELPENSRESCVVRTIFGRLRRLPDLKSGNQQLRVRAEREAINMPVQGTAADLVKMAMIRIHARLKDEAKASRLLLQVHDELLFEVAPEEIDYMRAMVKQEMEQVYKLRVPLLVDVHTGSNWLDLK